MSINGPVGLAKFRSKIKRDIQRDAIKDGVDPNDRAALQAWTRAKSLALWENLRSKHPTEEG